MKTDNILTPDDLMGFMDKFMQLRRKQQGNAAMMMKEAVRRMERDSHGQGNPQGCRYAIMQAADDIMTRKITEKECIASTVFDAVSEYRMENGHNALVESGWNAFMLLSEEEKLPDNIKAALDAVERDADKFKVKDLCSILAMLEMAHFGRKEIPGGLADPASNAAACARHRDAYWECRKKGIDPMECISPEHTREAADAVMSALDMHIWTTDPAKIRNALAGPAADPSVKTWDVVRLRLDAAIRWGDGILYDGMTDGLPQSAVRDAEERERYATDTGEAHRLVAAALVKWKGYTKTLEAYYRTRLAGYDRMPVDRIYDAWRADVNTYGMEGNDLALFLMTMQKQA